MVTTLLREPEEGHEEHSVVLRPMFTARPQKECSLTACIERSVKQFCSACRLAIMLSVTQPHSCKAVRKQPQGRINRIPLLQLSYWMSRRACADIDHKVQPMLASLPIGSAARGIWVCILAPMPTNICGHTPRVHHEKMG